MTLRIFTATILGVVEGLTEFIPVSSTGHLLLLGISSALATRNSARAFTVLIQFGAILALLSIYSRAAVAAVPRHFQRCAGAALRYRRADRVSAGGGHRRARLQLHQDALFNPWIVCVTLIIGGLMLFGSTGSISSRATTMPRDSRCRCIW